MNYYPAPPQSHAVVRGRGLFITALSAFSAAIAFNLVYFISLMLDYKIVMLSRSLSLTYTLLQIPVLIAAIFCAVASRKYERTPSIFKAAMFIMLAYYALCLISDFSSLRISSSGA